MSDPRPEEGASTDRSAAASPAVTTPEGVAAAAASLRRNPWPIALAVAVLLALAAAPFWAPLLPWGPRHEAMHGAELRTLDERLRTLEQRPEAASVDSFGALKELRAALDAASQKVAALEQRTGELASRPAGGGDAAATQRLTQAADESGRKIAALDARLAELDRKVAEKPAIDPAMVQALQGDVRKLAISDGELTDRLAKLEKDEAREASLDRADQVLLLALGRLREAAQSSRPFAAELGATKALAEGRPELAETLKPLEAWASKGNPSRAVLTQRFPEAASAIVRADHAPPGDDWSDQVMARLRSLVTIRRVGAGAVEGGAEAAVASAEAAVHDGDLAGAVAALETLKGAPAQAARPWLDEARARSAIEAALDKAQSLLVARLATSGGEAAGKSR
jgi:hypothetical protein